jgi:hypothetical protein
MWSLWRSINLKPRFANLNLTLVHPGRPRAISCGRRRARFWWRETERQSCSGLEEVPRVLFPTNRSSGACSHLLLAITAPAVEGGRPARFGARDGELVVKSRCVPRQEPDSMRAMGTPARQSLRSRPSWDAFPETGPGRTKRPIVFQRPTSLHIQRNDPLGAG